MVIRAEVLLYTPQNVILSEAKDLATLALRKKEGQDSSLCSE